MNQKSPDESGSSQNWKADMGVGYEYYGSTSRRVFSTRLSSSPSRVGMTNSPADSRSVDSLAGSGWLSPAGFRSMLPQSPGLKVAISPAEVSVGGGFPERSLECYIPSKSKTVVSPQSALVVLIPSEVPQADRAQRRFPRQGLPFSQQQRYSPAGWNQIVDEFLSRVSRAPQKSPLRGILFMHSSCR